MATPQQQDYVLSKSDKYKLIGCSVVIYFLWLVNISLTAWNVRSYYKLMVTHRDCKHCYIASYMILTISVECLTFLLLIATIPLVVFGLARGIRIYVTALFLTIWLELMLALVLSQEYDAIADVMRVWNLYKNITFFEVKVTNILNILYKCCGVLSSGDYAIIGGSPPNSCYKDSSGKTEDLYTTGCSTVSVKPTAMSVSVIISLVSKFLMVLAVVIYLIFLKRINSPRFTLSSMFPAVRIQTRS